MLKYISDWKSLSMIYEALLCYTFVKIIIKLMRQFFYTLFCKTQTFIIKNYWRFTFVKEKKLKKVTIHNLSEKNQMHALCKVS